MPANIVTIDIDAGNIRLLQARGNRVERWASAPLPPGLVIEGMVTDVVVFRDLVKTLMRASGISGGQVYASLNGLYSLSRVISLPKQPQGALEAAVARQAQEAMPSGELSLYWQTLASEADTLQVAVVGVPPTRVEAQVQALRPAGLAPRWLELKATALAKAVGRKEAVIVNAESASMDVVIVVAGAPQLMRTVGLGAEMEPAEAAEQVVSAVVQTVSFYQDHYTGEAALAPETPLFLVGPLSGEPALAEMLKSRLSFPMETFSPPLTAPPHMPLSPYAVNLGLALGPGSRGQRKNPNGQALPLRLNLLPRRQRLIASPRLLLPLLGLVAGLFLAFLLYQNVGEVAQQNDSLQVRVTTTEQQVKKRQQELSQLTQIEASVKEFNSIVASRGSLTNLAAELQKLAPPDIEVTSISVSSTTVSLGVNVKQSEQALEQAIAFIRILQTNALFQKVTYSTLPREGGTFTITLTLAQK